MNHFCKILCLTLLFPLGLFSQSTQNSVTADQISSINQFELVLQGDQIVIQIKPAQSGVSNFSINGEPETFSFDNGIARINSVPTFDGALLFLSHSEVKSKKLYHLSKYTNGQARLRKIPLWLSIIPPLLAIALALMFREVLLSLFVGIWSGAFIAGGLRVDSFYYFLKSIWRVFEVYVIGALNDSGHLSIIVFSMTIGGMVAIISRNGGMAGVVLLLSKYAKGPKSAQIITWLLGVAIFFDDYANTLIVGNTMRSVTDRFKVSREKLAYIVDSTAAPVAAIAFITTWIGAELGYIDDALGGIEQFPFEFTPYSVFISSLKYSFYPVLALCFILILAITGRDFGPMYQAEIKARSSKKNEQQSTEHDEVTEDLNPVPGAPLRWYNAVIPVLTVVIVTIIGLFDTGLQACYNQLVEGGFAVNGGSWSTIWGNLPNLLDGSQSFFMKLGLVIGNADSYVGLLWGSLSGVIAAILLTIFQRIMSMSKTMGTLIVGYKSMLTAIMILTLAWSLATTTDELHTADYLTQLLGDSLNPYFVPVLVFVMAAFISFSTGSSWSTMAILYPIAIPLTWYIAQTNGLDTDISLEILYNSIAVVLAASVLGDHCSPISDTTILSSLASDCPHIEHVRTQLPYALVVGVISLIATWVSTLLGGGWLVFILIVLISIGLLWAIVIRFGKKVPEVMP